MINQSEEENRKKKKGHSIIWVLRDRQTVLFLSLLLSPLVQLRRSKTLQVQSEGGAAASAGVSSL